MGRAALHEDSEKNTVVGSSPHGQDYSVRDLRARRRQARRGLDSQRVQASQTFLRPKPHNQKGGTT